MLRFAVFDELGPAKEWPLDHAHLVGPDDFGVPGEIRFAPGEIVVRRSGTGAVALALQYDAGGAGKLVLQTCLLPASPKPYVLSHELARHRIKTFLAKCEEWQMFELSTEHPAMVLWEEARQLFTKGLTARDPVKMDRFGRESLERAIEATERLAMAHAEVLLHRRYATRPASGTTLGVRVSLSKPPEQFAELLSREFDVIYVPLSWRDLEPSEGRYNWRPTDRWLTWAQEQGKPVIVGPLIDFSSQTLPKWMHVWQHDYDTARDLVYDHIARVFDRYRGVVSIWSLVAGINVNDNFRFTADQMLDLTRMANVMVRQGAQRSRTMLEIIQPFGEHAAKNDDSLPPLTFIDRVVQEGIRVDCYGLQIAFGAGAAGLPTRDMMQLSHMLDRFFLLELPLLITRIGAPSGGDSSDCGYWQAPWTPEVQARWVAKVFGLALSKPHVESFFWAELYDHAPSGIPYAGAIDAGGQRKPVLKRLIEMRRRLRKPLGPLKLSDTIGA